MGRMSSNLSSAQKSEWDFFLPRQAHEMVGFIVKKKTAATVFKSAMTLDSHPNGIWERKTPHVFVIYARYQDDWSLISSSATYFLLFLSQKTLGTLLRLSIRVLSHHNLITSFPFPFLESHLGWCLLCWMVHNQNPISYTVKTKSLNLPIEFRQLFFNVIGVVGILFQLIFSEEKF